MKNSTSIQNTFPSIITGIICFLFMCYIFYPGYMSHDSIAQYVQVKSGVTFNHHPPVMIYLWRFLENIIEGQGGFFLFHNILYWAGITIIACLISSTNIYRIAIIILVGLFPANLMMLPQTMKDTGVLATFTFAVAMLLLYRKHSSNYWILLACACLTYGSAARYNSLLSSIPLIGYGAYLCLRYHKINNHIIKLVSIITIIFTLIIIGAVYYINTMNVKPVALHPSLMVWDIASVSVAENKMLLPDYTINDKKLDINKLKSILDPTSNVSLCMVQANGLRSVLCREEFQFRRGDGLPSEYVGQIVKDWANVIINYPYSYLQHRFNITYELFSFTPPDNFPFHVGVIGDKHFPNVPYAKYDINIGFQANPAHDILIKIIDKLPNNIFFTGWSYLLVTIATMVVLFRQIRNNDLAVLGISIALSGILYVAPLFILTAAADFRYLVWLVMASLLTTIIAIKLRAQQTI